MAQQFQPPRDFSDEQAVPLSTSRLVVGLGEELAARVDAAAHDDLDAAGAMAADALSEIAGVALHTAQVASGGNVVLTVDVAEMVARLGEELGSLDGVRALYRLDPLTRREHDRLDLLFELDTAAAQDVAETVRTRGLGEFELFGDNPPRGQLSIDLAALLDEAQKQLEAAPGIRFVEREFLLQRH